MSGKTSTRFRAFSRLGLAVLLHVCVAHAAQAADLGVMKGGTLTYCSSMDAPPLSFYDESQQPQGFSVDIAQEVAKSLGNLKVEWRVMSFSGLIPALQARQCDLVIGQLFDKPERRQVIDIIDYMYSSQSIMVPRGNPRHVKSLDDLSGLKVAVINGSTIRALLEKENARLSAAGKPPMNIVVYGQDTDAFQAFRLQQVDAYGTTAESAAHFRQVTGNMFEEAVPSFNRIATGIGARKDEPLSKAVAKVVADLVKSDRYTRLIGKWKLENDRY
ncbi:ABC transporter substrate-binding protein [Burkholderia pseudomultivorans]|uniref:ABC transporter substrate-binding protein n=1 Tax=Burkholderia pseudomultivorans TaxID=1207504 RepID=A0A132EHY3_9BURK|nr:ABC transporter substrate-binding protein [Burkholderia pseudomultivorans]KWF30474.1 ABC transporter substrate-binding protein [Burkholderia pseudomultivorans]